MTGLTETWKKDSPIFVLGAWCLRDDRRSDWESLDRHLMPCPWDDRTRFYETCHYLEERIESLLEKLTAHLNRVHGTEFSRRFWRILVGPWLTHFVHAVFDRQVYLREAFQADPELQTLALAPESFQTPYDFDDFIGLVLDDPYNFQIFSELLEKMNKRFPTVKIKRTDHLERRAPGKPPRQSLFRLAAKKVLAEAGNFLGRKRRPGTALCEMYFSQALNWRLAAASEFRCFPLHIGRQWTFPRSRVSVEKRSFFSDIVSVDDFEKLVLSLMPRHFPVLYLEDFEKAGEEIEKKYPKNLQSLASLNGWYSNEPFKFLAAMAAEHGARLFSAQCGGGYGVARYTPLEHHESAVADAYFVWGWAKPGTNQRNLPGPKLSTQIKRSPIASAEGRSILFITTAHSRYLFRFASAPIGNQLENYFSGQKSFLRGLPEELRGKILYRPHWIEYGQGWKRRLLEEYPFLELDNSRSWMDRLSEIRLVVIDHPSTSYLESLVGNIPTVLFWNSQQWEVRDEVESDFQDLRRAGILWESPEDAAAHVARVYGSVDLWWNSSSVQTVREKFVERYALSRGKWAREWARVLEEFSDAKAASLAKTA